MASFLVCEVPPIFCGYWIVSVGKFQAPSSTLLLQQDKLLLLLVYRSSFPQNTKDSCFLEYLTPLEADEVKLHKNGHFTIPERKWETLRGLGGDFLSPS